MLHHPENELTLSPLVKGEIGMAATPCSSDQSLTKKSTSGSAEMAV
jgi:hypothetical protein